MWYTMLRSWPAYAPCMHICCSCSMHGALGVWQASCAGLAVRLRRLGCNVTDDAYVLKLACAGSNPYSEVVIPVAGGDWQVGDVLVGNWNDPTNTFFGMRRGHCTTRRWSTSSVRRTPYGAHRSLESSSHMDVHIDCMRRARQHVDPHSRCRRGHQLHLPPGRSVRPEEYRRVLYGIRVWIHHGSCLAGQRLRSAVQVCLTCVSVYS